MSIKIWLPAVRAGTGADIYTERLAAGLQANGMDAAVTWFSRYMELFPPVMKLMPVPSGTSIIHANSRNALGCRRDMTKLVVTVHHGIPYNRFTRYRSPMQIAYNDYLICNYEKYGIKHADRVVAVSYYTAERLKEFFHAENVEVIHNGIDTDYFTPGQAGITPSRFRLLFVGKPSRMKGFDMLGSVMKRLGDDFELIYTSPGKGTTSMHPGNMHTSGYLYGEDLLRAYRDCDALISPSRLEGFGYSVCEAMACGKPVIVSDNSSLSEIVQHGETGFLCPTDDVDAFAEAARKLAGDPLLAGRMGEAARQHVLKHFRIESMIERYIRLYQSLVP